MPSCCMPLPHSSRCPSLLPISSELKSRSQNSSSDLDVDPTVARTTCLPRGDHRMVLVVREVNVPGMFSDKQRGSDPERLFSPTQKLEVAFPTFKLVEADISLNGDTGTWIPKIGVVA